MYNKKSKKYQKKNIFPVLFELKKLFTLQC